MGRVVRSALVGGAVGMCFGMVPYIQRLSELRHFQIFLLEVMYQALDPRLSPAMMRALSTRAGELALLATLGLVIGLLVGLAIVVIEQLRGRPGTTPVGRVAVSGTLGVLGFVFLMLWCRVIFIHSSTSRMISGEGLLMLGGSLLVAGLFGWLVFTVLSALSRARLAKLALAVVIIGLLVLSAGPFPRSRASAATPGASSVINQVVVLGIDGATWDVALPMIKQGRLPHFQRLMERGSWGPIRATIPWKSPIIWTSIATGKRQREHGINDFIVWDKRTKSSTPMSIGSRKVKAVWDILSEAGVRIDVASWYGNWPAEPINGTMISDRLLLKSLPQRITPESRSAELDAYAHALKHSLPKGKDEKIDELVDAEMALHLLEQDKPQVQMIYLREIDDMQHYFWRYYAARHGSIFGRWLYGPVDPREVEKHGGNVERAYERADAVLGRIMTLAGPQTAIVVLSDHGAGMKSLRELNFSLNPLLERWGLMAFDANGKDIDWARTKVYDSNRGQYEVRDLYVNERVEGPFAKGMSPADAQALLQSLQDKLRAVRTSSGKVVVTELHMNQPTAGIHLSAKVNAELRRVPGDSIALQDAPGEPIPVSRVVWRTELSGTHRLHGLILMAGPGIKAGGRLRAASVLDLTPTLLYMANQPVADDMRGRVLLEAFDGAHRTQFPVKWVPTYETGGRTATVAPESSADDALKEQLRSLGYIQ